MTPEQWQDALLGQGLAFVLFAVVVVLIVRHEWVVSAPHRDARRKVKP